MKLVAEKSINENPVHNVNDQTMIDVNSSVFQGDPGIRIKDTNNLFDLVRQNILNSSKKPTPAK